MVEVMQVECTHQTIIANICLVVPMYDCDLTFCLDIFVCSLLAFS